MEDKKFTKEDFKKFVETRSDSVFDFLWHVASKMNEYDEDKFIVEYLELPRRNSGKKRNRYMAKRDWKLLKMCGY